MRRAPEVIGVAGARTMGAGISRVALATGAPTLLHDPTASHEPAP